MSKKNEVATLNEEQLAQLNNAYPVSTDSARKSYPRFGMLSKDITEESGTGKNKKITVIEAAGTFYTEKDEGAIDPETGKKVWTKTYLGDSVEVILPFYRKQLRLFDKSLNKFISSPIYDSADQVIPLYLDKRIIAKGTPQELRDLYPKMTEKGKKSSKLNEETILYVLYEGELYQCNLSISSGWSFRDYRKNVNPSTVVTTLSSIEETNGSNTYRKMTFTSKRLINGADEFDAVKDSQETLTASVEADKQYFLGQASTPVDDGDKELQAMVDSAHRALK